jgi:hypothetical protein
MSVDEIPHSASNIWHNFTTIANYLKVNRGRKCRERCAGCDRKWGETGTTHVHMEIKQNKQAFLCDACVKSKQQ